MRLIDCTERRKPLLGARRFGFLLGILIQKSLYDELATHISKCVPNDGANQQQKHCRSPKGTTDKNDTKPTYGKSNCCAD